MVSNDFKLQTFRNYWGAYFPEFSFVWVTVSALVTLFAFWNIYQRMKTSNDKRICYIRAAGGAVGAGYAVLLFDILVAAREVSNRGCSFIPFSSYRQYLEGGLDYLYVNIFNVILFIPLGFFLFLGFSSFGGKGNVFGRIVLTGALISLSMEVLQLLLSRGFAEIDDVFHNTLGTFLGAVIAYGIERLCSFILVSLSSKV